MEHNSYKIGVVGHINLGGIDSELFVYDSCYQLLSRLKTKYPHIIAISAISSGADSVFAKSANALNIELEAVIPFINFHEDFQDNESYENYRILRNLAISETKLGFSKRNDIAYRKSMEWIVFTSNTIIAIWDGKEIGSTGGTWESVALCRKLKKKMIHINTINKNISLYSNETESCESFKGISIDNLIGYI